MERMDEQTKKAYLRTVETKCSACDKNIDVWEFSENGGVCQDCKLKVR